MINNKGDNGSPCLNPLACLMLWLGLPFVSILDEEDARIAAIQLRCLILKPIAARTSRRYFQPMESKAFEMSSLIKRLFFPMKKLDHLSDVQEVIMDASCLMKAFCARDTRSFICGASLVARIFVMILTSTS